MTKQLLIALFASLFLGGCAAQAYTVADEGVYYGTDYYDEPQVGLSLDFSGGHGWYGYPWASVAYQRHTSLNSWPGYVSLGYGPRGYFGGFNLNFGSSYSSPYYRYSSNWGYDPYYGFGYSGFRRSFFGPYSYSFYNPYSWRFPYRHNHRGNRYDYRYGYDYDRRGRDRDRRGRDHGRDRYGHDYDRRGRDRNRSEHDYDRRGRDRNRSGHDYDRRGRDHDRDRTGRDYDRRGRDRDRYGYDNDRRGRDRDNNRGRDRNRRQPEPRPVRIVRLEEPGHEGRFAENRPTRPSIGVKSRSGQKKWKGNQPPPQRVHQDSGKQIQKTKPQPVYAPGNRQAPVTVVRRGSDSDDREARRSPSQASRNTRSASGRSHYKGSKPPPQELHRRQQKPQPKYSPTDSRRPVTIVRRRESQADEMDARHTPSRPSLSQRSTSGRNQHKNRQAPPQRIHSRGGAEKPAVASRPVAVREDYRQAQRRPAAPVQQQQRQQAPQQPRVESRPQSETSDRGRKSNDSDRGRSKDKKQGRRR